MKTEEAVVKVKEIVETLKRLVKGLESCLELIPNNSPNWEITFNKYEKAHECFSAARKKLEWLKISPYAKACVNLNRLLPSQLKGGERNDADLHLGRSD
jgi:hypothetical protein